MIGASKVYNWGIEIDTPSVVFSAAQNLRGAIITSFVAHSWSGNWHALPINGRLRDVASNSITYANSDPVYGVVAVVPMIVPPGRGVEFICKVNGAWFTVGYTLL